VVLRDGRHLVGTMRSFDQFSNFVLEDTFERHVAGDKYGDIPLGLYIIRGENVVLLGEIDDAKQAAAGRLHEVEMEEILALVQEQAEKDEGKKVVDLWNFDHES